MGWAVEVKMTCVMCPEHRGTRMTRKGEGKETFGLPPTPIRRFYRCQYGCEWTHFLDINGLAPGWHEEAVTAD